MRRGVLEVAQPDVITTELDCPCCGDVGALADAAGLFADGQALVCGCKGSVSCDSETDAYVWVDDCDCEQ